MEDFCFTKTTTLTHIISEARGDLHQTNRTSHCPNKQSIVDIHVSGYIHKTMKFALVSAFLACACLSAVQAGKNPDCKVSDVDGYYNCKRYFFVNGAGSDALWCVNELDCFKVFPAPTPLPTPKPPTEPAIASLESFSSAGTLTTSTAALFTLGAVLLH